MAEDTVEWRFFVTYSGVKLPLRMVNPIEPGDLNHRNTYFRARYDDQERLLACEKMVYGDVQLAHYYQYAASGGLTRAEIIMGDETTVMNFDEAGQPIRD